MEKKMEKGKSIMMIVSYYLKENILMEEDGMGKDII